MFIFITGTGFCGTSLLGYAFAKHPEVLYFYETGMLCIWEKLKPEKVRNGIGGRHHKPNPAYSDGDVVDDPYVELLLDYWTEDRLLALHSPEIVGGTNHEQTLYSAFFTPVLKRRVDFYETSRKMANKSIVVEKDPDLTGWFRFSSDKRVVVFRYPPDVYSSMLNKEPGNALEKIEDWIDYYIKVSETSIQKESEVYIDMERFIKNPNLDDVFDELNIEYDRDIIKHCVSHIDPAKGNVGRWKGNVSQEDHDRIMTKCGPLHERLKKRSI